MKKILYFLCSLLLGFNLNAQSDFWKSKDAYLGQKRPGETPVIFAKGLLVDSGIAFCRVAFSNDGREFFYTFAKSWFSREGSGTNCIRFDGKEWGHSSLIAKELTVPSLSIDGQLLFLLGKGSVLWKSDKVKDGWSMPAEYLDLSFGLYNFMPTQSGNLYVGSNGDWGKKNDYSTYNFSMLTIDGKDTVIKSLGSPLNKPGFNGDFYIAPDESYIIISTNESSTYECELYISFRKKDKTWTTPLSLGDDINKGKAHRFGQYVSPDGKYLFYTWGTSEKNTNIYWMRFDRLREQLRKQSFEK